ncbi:hypothetical protein [Lactobacillus nasalidis]|uniref:hypothetical protein n=1 Tax=Lactobacillus nasalidis TaxID=2797258 RepID=UPI0019155D96|nr:hypothetical protein [Lactobacillus nasalidis]
MYFSLAEKSQDRKGFLGKKYQIRKNWPKFRGKKGQKANENISKQKMTGRKRNESKMEKGCRCYNSAGCTQHKPDEKVDLTFQK